MLFEKSLLPLSKEPVFIQERFENKKKRILTNLSQAISQNTAQAVYLDMVNVQQMDNSLQTSIIDGKLLQNETIHKRYPSVLFFDTAWDLIKPSRWYKKLVIEGLNLTEKDVLGTFTGNFNALGCEKGGIVYKPEIDAGSFNPYKKIAVARASASRRMKVLNYLDKVANKKFSLMQTVVTLPENISDILFNEKSGKKKFHKITTLFVNKLESFLQGHAKVSKDFKIGVWLNEHIWSSKKPLNHHLHGHLCYPNILVNKKTQKIVRFKPFFSEEQIEFIKILWKKTIQEVFGYHESLDKEINIFHSYSKEKPKKLHLLKYCTRSWLHDLGKYFNNCQSQEDDIRFENYFNWMKSQFARLVEFGAVENRTYALGFLHNTKKIFDAYGIYYDFKHDNNRFCDLCGSKHSYHEKISGLPKIPELVIIMGHKTSYRMVGILKNGK